MIFQIYFSIFPDWCKIYAQRYAHLKIELSLKDFTPSNAYHTKDKQFCKKMKINKINIRSPTLALPQQKLNVVG